MYYSSWENTSLSSSLFPFSLLFFLPILLLTSFSNLCSFIPSFFLSSHPFPFYPSASFLSSTVHSCILNLWLIWPFSVTMNYLIWPKQMNLPYVLHCHFFKIIVELKHHSAGKFWKRWAYQTTWPASWETYMQVKKQQLELDMKQQTGSK